MTTQHLQDKKNTKNAHDMALARQILGIVMQYRRLPSASDACANSDCERCQKVHLGKVVSAVAERQRVRLVLPAFPGKSPNPEKVLGHLPDFAEQLALTFLTKLTASINELYAPGCELIICSDGRVFSDVVGMKELHVTQYQIALQQLIKQQSASSIKTFNMDDYYKTHNFSKMREQLMQRYAAPLTVLKQKIKNGAKSNASSETIEANRMYRGITRFLFEDAMHAGQMQSRTAVQKDARARAYEVIRRSNAWSELIADEFPDAVRLSIHPQTCGSKKLGIRLVGEDAWMTPWHGVALIKGNQPILMRRAKADALGAELVYASNGAPSHYRLNKGL